MDTLDWADTKSFQVKRTFSLFFLLVIILSWVNYAFLVCICFEMLSHLFAESVTCHSLLISWTCVDAVKGNVMSLPKKDRIAVQPLLPSILKVYLHDVLCT